MSIIGIEKIKEAEAKAAELRKNSEEKAADLIAAGKREANMIVEKAGREAEADYKAVLAKAEEEASWDQEKRMTHERESCEALKEAGRANKSAAVESIVRKVVDSYGNS